MGDQHNGVDPSPSVRASWRLRLCDGRQGVKAGDEVLGAGILLPDQLVLTCAHVLPDRNARLIVEFPETDAIPSTTATVVEDGWHPATSGPNGRWPGGDVALLELDPPRPEAHAAPLSLALPYRGRRVWMCGYPERQDAGTSVEAEIRNPHGAALLQLKPPDASEAIRPGFSGAAVIDSAGLDGHRGSAPQSIVLGMVVSRYHDLAKLPAEERQRHGYMIPTDQIVKLIPRLRRYAAGAPARDTSLSIPQNPHLGPAFTPDPKVARELGEWLDEESTLPRPAALLVATGGDQRRDLAVRESLEGVDLALDAAGRSTQEVRGALLTRLGLPDSYEDGLRGWLADGQGAPPGLPDAAPRSAGGEDAPGARSARDDGGEAPGFSLTVAVHGVDVATEPHELVGLLVRLREMGCRVLAVCHHDSGSVWSHAARELLAPALRETAAALIDILLGLEREARRRPPAPGTSRVPEVAVERALRPVRLGMEPDPARRLRGLRQLVDQLYADIARRRPGPGPDAENTEPGGQA